MKGLFPGTPGRKLVLAFVCLGLFASGAFSAEPEADLLYRYTLKDGNEVYAAKWEGRKKVDQLKNISSVKSEGYVFLKQLKGTIALIQLRNVNLAGKSEFVTTTDVALIAKLLDQNKTQAQSWAPYPASDGVIGFVSDKPSKYSSPVYSYTRKNIWANRIGYSFEDENTEMLKLAGAKFSDYPAFYVWSVEPTAENMNLPVPEITAADLVPGGSKSKSKGTAIGGVAGKQKSGSSSDSGGITAADLAPGGGPTDQGLLRKALYDNGKDSVKLDGTRPFGGPGKPLVVYKKDAVACPQDVCKFFVGFYIGRDNDRLQLMTNAAAKGGAGSSSSSALFKAGEKTIGHVLPVFLNPGSNMITITLKPEKPGDDTNPNNNTFTVEVILKP